MTPSMHVQIITLEGDQFDVFLRGPERISFAKTTSDSVYRQALWFLVQFLSLVKSYYLS